MPAVKLGAEFLVNTTTTFVQTTPAVTTLGGGGFVVTWRDASASGTDTSGFSVRAQIYDNTGAAVGGEFLVNTETVSDQLEPTVTGLFNGGFVVSWTDYSLVGGDASGAGIKAQIFDSNGAKVGGEVLVNTETTNHQTVPTITSLTNGGFVVSWTDVSRTGSDTSGTAIKAQIFDSAGVQVGSELEVNTAGANDQKDPTITGLAGGGFVVSWTDQSMVAPDTAGYGVKAQIYAFDGTPVGVESLINTATSNDQLQPTIAALSGGGFVAAWSDLSGLADTNGYGITMQMFDAVGSKVFINDILVNTETGGFQTLPTIATLANGGFVIAWQDASGMGGDASSNGIKAQVFDTTGTKIGDEFLVNTETMSNQSVPSITGLSNGDFVVSWSDASGIGGDASSNGIKAQLFTLAPVITAVTIPDQAMHLGQVVTATITVATDSDTYTLGVGSTIGGYDLGGLTKVNDTTYTATFTVTAGTDIAASASLPVNLVLLDGSSIAGPAYSTAVVQASDAIDASAPSLVLVTVDGTQLVLTYDQPLDAAHPPVAGDFTAEADGSPVTVSSVAVDPVAGTVTLTLATAIEQGQTVYVNYQDPTAGDDANALQDAAGSDAASLIWNYVSNNTQAPAPDTTAPVITAVTIPDQAMHLGQEVTATITVATDSDTYTLGVGSTIGGYDLGGLTKVNDTTYTATFTVTAGVDVAASASLPVNLVLLDGASNASPAYTTAVVQTSDAIDASAPDFVSATVNGTQLVLTYGEALDAAHPPVAGDFVVHADNNVVVVSSVLVDAVAGTVTLTLATAVTQSQFVYVDYTDPTAGDDANALQDAAGSDAATLPSWTGVTNNTPVPVDTTAPVITAVTIPDQAMHLGQEVTATITVASDGDTYTLGAGSTIGGYALGGLTKVNDTTYTATFTVTAGMDIAASATLPVNLVLVDGASNASPAYATAVVQASDAIDASAPVFVSATVNGTQLVLTYGESLDAAHPPVAGDFDVTAGSNTIVVSSVLVDAVAGTVTLTLGTAIVHGQSVVVSYGDPTAGDDANALQDAAGSDAITVLLANVTNNTAAPDTTAPLAPVLALASDTGNSAVDTITRNGMLVVTPAEPGGTLEYSTNGGATYSPTAPVYAQDGSADGLHLVQARQLDAAGNISAAASINFVLDTVAPSAASTPVSLTVQGAAATGPLRSGDVATVTVSLNEAITLSPGGEAVLSLSNGAVLTGGILGSGGQSLVFQYTVAPAQDTADLQVTGLSLLSGSTLRDAAGNDALLSGVTGSLGVAVETIVPNQPATGAPAIAGTAMRGEVLSAGIGTLADPDGIDTVAYHWQRDDGHGGWSDILGASASSYTLAREDIGHAIRAVAEVTDELGIPGTAFSEASAPVAAREVTFALPTGELSDARTLTYQDLQDRMADGDILAPAAGTDEVRLADGTLGFGGGSDIAFVTRLYEGVLGRTGEMTGMISWTGGPGADIDRVAVAREFLESPEYQALHGVQTDLQFLETIYRETLLRDIDADGLTFWQDRLAAGAPREDVLVGIADSAEARQAWDAVTEAGVFVQDPNAGLIKATYQAGLDREADTGGLAYYAGLFQAGMTDAAFGDRFETTPEFQSMHGAQTDAEYVQSLYVNALGRAGGAEEVAGWETRLVSQAMDRSDVLLSFVYSEEGRDHLDWAL